MHCGHLCATCEKHKFMTSKQAFCLFGRLFSCICLSNVVLVLKCCPSCFVHWRNVIGSQVAWSRDRCRELVRWGGVANWQSGAETSVGSWSDEGAWLTGRVEQRQVRSRLWHILYYCNVSLKPGLNPHVLISHWILIDLKWNLFLSINEGMLISVPLLLTLLSIAID